MKRLERLGRWYTVKWKRPQLSPVTKLLWLIAAGLLVSLAIHAAFGGV